MICYATRVGINQEVVMKRTVTGFCVAAAFGCVATISAQTPTPTTPPATGQRAPMAEKAKDVTLTGCLSKGADGKYLLTNASIDNHADDRSATTPPARTETAPQPAAGAMKAAATSWALAGGSDLDKHVGHKIQVTGRTSWDSAMDHARTPNAAAPATGTSSVGTSGTTSTAKAEDQRKDMQADQPQLDVQSVRMVAPSYS